MAKNWKPWFFENSRVPVLLSRVAPIEIGAITLFCFVFARGEINEVTRRHETIHFQQMLELLIIPVPMLLFYLYDYLKGLIVYRNNWEGSNNQRGYPYYSAANRAYHNIRAEQEAYDHEQDEDYLSTRPRYAYLWNYRVK